MTRKRSETSRVSNNSKNRLKFKGEAYAVLGGPEGEFEGGLLAFAAFVVAAIDGEFVFGSDSN